MNQTFIDFSAEVTAFTTFELFGTGQAKAYFDTVTGIVGNGVVNELLTAYSNLRGLPQPDRDIRMRRDIFGDEKLGPIARNIIRLWYIGIWSELPQAWTEAFGALENNVGGTVSAAAYTEGLLWPAVGANPPGAKGPGYGSWALPPRIPAIQDGSTKARAAGAGASGAGSGNLYPDIR